MKDSDIISKLIYLAFINPPEPIPPAGKDPFLKWDDAMGCFGRAVEREAHLLPDLDDLLIRPSGVTWQQLEGLTSPDPDPAPDPQLTETPVLRAHSDVGDPSIKRFPGKGGNEKQDVYDRLRSFRSAYGLGCLQEVADATGGLVSDDRIRDLINGGRADLEIWRTVGKALDVVVRKKGAAADAKS